MEGRGNDSRMFGRLLFSFFDVPCVQLANQLLGKILVRKLENSVLIKGRIVETECYLGRDDKSCHSYNGKRTPRNEAMFMPPGTAYVYSIYGMYYCFNISSQEEGSAVLIRALEPLEGVAVMKSFRGGRRKDNGANLKNHQICNGPSKLCQALCIEKELLNKKDLTSSELLWLEEDDQSSELLKHPVVRCHRIGIESAGSEWALKPLRFYLFQNMYVSVRNKTAEKLISI